MPSSPISAEVFDALGWISIALLCILVVLLLLGPFRKYPLILTYCLVQLILTAGENHFLHTNRKLYAILYWTDEIILNLLLFLMVVTFTYRALDDHKLRAAMGKVLAGVFVVVVCLPLLVFKGPAFVATSWFNHTSQLLSFAAAILNLGLWTALVTNRRRDSQLLAVCAGLGVAVTGAAISYGVRGYVVKDWLWLPDIFMSATFVVSMAIWCWTFRPQRAQNISL